MGYIRGRVLKDVALPEVPLKERRPIMMNMIKVLAQIHDVDIDKVGLSDFGKKGKYLYVFS